MNSGSTALVWVLLDEVAGHMNQALGVAEALNLPYEAKNLKYTDAVKWPNILRFSSLRGLTPESAAEISEPWPDLVISAGRKTAPVAQYIKRKSKGRALTCHIMNPGFPSWGLDLLALPEHDGRRAGKKIVTTIGAPNRVQPDFLQQESAIWERTLSPFASPRFAVLLGGDTKGIAYNGDDGRTFAAQLQQFTGRKGSLLISASRRSPQPFVDAFKNSITQSHYVHDPAKTRTNPYYAFLSLADAVIVTADSVSMISEACSSGKPVFLFRPAKFDAHKHERFLFSVIRQGYAKWLGAVGVFSGSTYSPRLEASQTVAARLQEMLANR